MHFFRSICVKISSNSNPRYTYKGSEAVFGLCTQHHKPFELVLFRADKSNARGLFVCIYQHQIEFFYIISNVKKQKTATK